MLLYSKQKLREKSQNTYNPLLFQMLRKLFLHDISVSNQHLDNGLGKSLHIPFPYFRIWTLQFGDHVETLSQLGEDVYYGVTE